MKNETEFLRDPIIKKYGGFMQKASSSNGPVNNKDDYDATMPPSGEPDEF